MAKGFLTADRDQQYLLPPDMRDWLPEGHFVWFLIDVIDGLDMTGFEAKSRLGGAGRAPYDPRTLLAVLVYGYSRGIRSSRRLEAECLTDAALRVITGDDPPDHCTIARFRARHDDQLGGLFTQVLALCSSAGMVKLGIVALDGTRIAANASKDRNASSERLHGLLHDQARAILDEAAAVDAAEDELFGDARGDEIDPQFVGPGAAAKIKKLIEELEAEQAASGDQEDKAAEFIAAAADPEIALFRGRAPRGTDPVKLAKAKLARARTIEQRKPRPNPGSAGIRNAKDAVAKARRQRWSPPPPAATPVRNLTDPDSRLIHTRNGWIQGYNAQLAVSEDHYIIAAELTASPNDNAQFIPMMHAIEAAATMINNNGADQQEIGTIIADAGYHSQANLAEPGPDRLIAAGKSLAVSKQAASQPTDGPPPPAANASEANAHRLRTPEGLKLYRKRGATVEPVNGHLKDNTGLRAMSRRGIAAANSELKLAAATLNLTKLHRARLA